MLCLSDSLASHCQLFLFLFFYLVANTKVASQSRFRDVRGSFWSTGGWNRAVSPDRSPV